MAIFKAGNENEMKTGGWQRWIGRGILGVFALSLLGLVLFFAYSRKTPHPAFRSLAEYPIVDYYSGVGAVPVDTSIIVKVFEIVYEGNHDEMLAKFKSQAPSYGFHEIEEVIPRTTTFKNAEDEMVLFVRGDRLKELPYSEKEPRTTVSYARKPDRLEMLLYRIKGK